MLIARRPSDPEAFPARIAVGLDGSPEADAAARVADGLAERFGAGVREVVATGGKGIEADAIRAARPGIEIAARKPLEALVEASAEADLVIVGNRGRHGLKSLGSVSERLAHQARCSVLVVRSSA